MKLYNETEQKLLQVIWNTYLVLCWLKPSSWNRSYNNKSMQEMTFDTGGTERGVVVFYENHTNNIVTNVTFSL